MAKVGPQKAGALGLRAFVDAGQIDPRDRRMHVMMQVPVVIKPKPIDKEKGAKITGPLLHVPNRAEVVRVLHRGPDKTEAKKRGKIVQDGNMPVPHKETVEHNDE